MHCSTVNRDFKCILQFTMAAVVTALLIAPRAEAMLIGPNLIVNGDAEAGVGSAGGFDILNAPGWTQTGDFTVVEYGAPGGFPTLVDPGPTVRGENFFSGGPSNGSSSASQSIDVSAESGMIDAGSVAFSLEAFLGGYDSQGDNAVLTAIFNGIGGLISSVSLGPVTNTDRGNATGLLARSASGLVPIGTINVDIVLDMTRLAGSYNDGYADNLSFILRRSQSLSVPEPTGLSLLALLALGLTSKRRAA